MKGVKGWMWKHYSKGNSNSVKCSHCGIAFSSRIRTQVLNFHLYDDHDIIELDEHPERDNIKENYKISSITAKCNHCKKLINLTIHGVHILTNHLRVLHSDIYNLKKTGIRSSLWDRYDVTDNKAMCKGCKKTIKVHSKRPLSSLHQHLRYYCHFNSNHSNNLINERRPHVWDKYDVKDNNATCKGCKKTIKMNGIYPISNLIGHLLYCRPFKINDPNNLNNKRNPSHVWDKYDVIDNNAICKGCKKTIKVYSKNPISGLRQHLCYCRHFKMEHLSNIYKERRTSYVWDEYDVTDNNATCKGCKKQIKMNSISPISNLIRHLRHCRFAPASLRSKGVNDFYGNKPQKQNGVQTDILTQPLKRKIKEENAGTALTSLRSKGVNNFLGNETQIESGDGTNILTQPFKRKREETEKSEEKAPSTSGSTADFHGTMQFQSGIRQNQVQEETENKDVNFGYPIILLYPQWNVWN